MDRIKEMQHKLFKEIWHMDYLAAKSIVKTKDLDQIMRKLLSFGLDSYTDGFWLLNINSQEERYSPKYITSLGYEGDHDFPPVMASWMNAITPESLKIAYDEYQKHIETRGEHEYRVRVLYNKKHGGKLDLICSGAVVDWEHDPIMLGTHEILR